jgi:hypothetical protein
LTKVTREHRSGANCVVLSRVDRKIENEGEKSISRSPSVTSTRPPVLCTSRFSTGFRIGSMLSTSSTSSCTPAHR